MSAKHTPGPWIAPSGGIFTESGKLIACISDPRMARQASAPDGIPGMDEGHANAGLIACAPDLLDLIEAAALRVEMENKEGNPILSGWLIDAKSAIQKARGE